MTNETEAPERIWANFYDDGVPRSGDCFDDPVTEGLKEYVSADLYNAQAARIAELEAERDKLRNRSSECLSALQVEIRRAEAAEAKLAKAVDIDLIEQCIRDVLDEGGTIRSAAEYVARATLAELKGGE